MSNKDFRIVLDIETQDPGISAESGSSWPLGTVKFLVAGTYDDTNGFRLWEDPQELINYLKYFTHIVGHNISYDIGVMTQFGFDPKPFTIIDTLILAKLNDNTRQTYSLDALSKELFNEKKTDEALGKVAMDLGLVKSKAQNPIKIAKKHMDRVYEAAKDLVCEYVIQDVTLTMALYMYLRDQAPGFEKAFYSDLIKALIESRKRGVRVDLTRAREVREKILSKENPVRDFLLREYPALNINSSQQLAALFRELGEEIPLTEKGNPSITAEWLNSSEHPIAKDIAFLKRCEKLRRDFLEPLLEKYPDQKYCTIHPEITIFGAAATGRASSSNPNIQQIPKRDKEFGSLIRSIYVPHEGETWYSLDFSAQEPRIQVHFAHMAGCKGAAALVEAYKKNPKLDLHQTVADIVGIDRGAAKTVNLGVAYGMGDKKLSHSLKVSLPEAKDIKSRMDEKMPYLLKLDRICKKVIKERGFIITLNRRHLRNERGFESKALNKLVQGSAADQTWSSIVEAYRQGIIILFPVHDELNLSTADPKQAEKLKEIMLTSAKLVVPSYTEITSGPSWGELK